MLHNSIGACSINNASLIRVGNLHFALRLMFNCMSVYTDKLFYGSRDIFYFLAGKKTARSQYQHASVGAVNAA